MLKSSSAAAAAASPLLLVFFCLFLLKSAEMQTPAQNNGCRLSKPSCKLFANGTKICNSLAGILYQITRYCVFVVAVVAVGESHLVRSGTWLVFIFAITKQTETIKRNDNVESEAFAGVVSLCASI